MPTIFARISCAVWLFTCVYRHAQTAVEVGSLMNKNIVLTSSISCLYLRSFIRYQSPRLTLSFIQIDNIFSRVLVFGKCTACSFWWSLHSEFSLTFYMFWNSYFGGRIPKKKKKWKSMLWNPPIQQVYDGIEGFHVTLYLANFASHTRNHHVGFLFPWHGIGKHNKMSCYFLFRSYHHNQITTEWQEFQHTHSVAILNPSMK